MGKRNKLNKQNKNFHVRMEVGKGLILLANLAGGSLLFGQAVSGQRFNFEIALVSFLVMPFLYSLAVSVMKGGDKKK